MCRHLYDGSSHDDNAVAADRTTEHAAVQTGVSMSRRRWLTAMPARKKYTASSTYGQGHSRCNAGRDLQAGSCD